MSKFWLQNVFVSRSRVLLVASAIIVLMFTHFVMLQGHLPFFNQVKPVLPITQGATGERGANESNWPQRTAQEEMNELQGLLLLAEYAQRAYQNHSASGCPGGRERPVLVTAVDFAYIALFRNFYKTAVLFHNLQSCFQVYCFDNRSAEIILLEFGINCTCVGKSFESNQAYFGTCDAAVTQDTDFGTYNFHWKSNLKTAVILHQLEAGRAVLFSDADIVFLQNPFEGLLNRRLCPDKADVCFMNETGRINTGFVFARCNNHSLTMYRLFVQACFSKFRSNHDQSIFSTDVLPAIKQLNLSLHMEILPTTSFMNGAQFFDASDVQLRRFFFWQHDWRQLFAGTYVIHVNFMVGRHFKRYVMRETLLWYDDAGAYYTSPTRRYLLPDQCYVTDPIRIRYSLHVAIAVAAALNRTLVLPRFACDFGGQSECNLGFVVAPEVEFWSSESVDFRENSFLVHPYVPDSTKLSVSPLLPFMGLIDTQLRPLRSAQYTILRLSGICEFRLF